MALVGASVRPALFWCAELEKGSELMNTSHRKFVKPGDLLPGDFVHGSNRVVYHVRPLTLRQQVRVFFTDGTQGDYAEDIALSVRRRGSTLEQY